MKSVVGESVSEMIPNAERLAALMKDQDWDARFLRSIVTCLKLDAIRCLNLNVTLSGQQRRGAQQ